MRTYYVRHCNLRGCVMSRLRKDSKQVLLTKPSYNTQRQRSGLPVVCSTNTRDNDRTMLLTAQNFVDSV